MRITVQLRYLLLAAAAFVAIGALLVATVQAQTPPPQDDKPSSGSEAESPPLPTPTPIPQDGPQDSGSDGEPRGTASDPTITIASYASPVMEGGTVYFRLTASSAPSAHVEINLQATGGTSFLTATPVNSIGLGPGLTVAWLILGTEDDTVDEPDGTITSYGPSATPSRPRTSITRPRTTGTRRGGGTARLLRVLPAVSGALGLTRLTFPPIPR